MGCRCGSIHILSTEKRRENSDRGSELRTKLSLITPHLNTGYGVVVETIDRFAFGSRIRAVRLSLVCLFLCRPSDQEKTFAVIFFKEVFLPLASQWRSQRR